MTSDDFNKIEEMLKYHLQILSTEVHYKLDILIEGCRMLNEKVDRILERTGS